MDLIFGNSIPHDFVIECNEEDASDDSRFVSRAIACIAWWPCSRRMGDTEGEAGLWRSSSKCPILDILSQISKIPSR